MALGSEIRVDESTSRRSQATGELVVVMPKLGADNCVGVKKIAEEKVKTTEDKIKDSKAVSIRNIVVDEADVPPLI